MAQVLENETINNVAAKIAEAFNRVSSADGDRKSAQEYLTEASQTATNSREDLLVSLANYAHQEKLSEYDLTTGIERALEARNSKDNSIKTFASEISRACHRSARQHVAAFRELAREAWEAEGAADPKLPKPCRKAFQRRYHMLGRMITEAMDGNVLASHTDVVQWAVACDPSKDPKRAYKRLEAIRKELLTLADEFPIDGLIAGREELASVTMKDFRGAPATPSVKPIPKPAPEADEGEDDTADNVSEIAEGVVDMDKLLEEAVSNL